MTRMTTMFPLVIMTVYAFIFTRESKSGAIAGRQPGEIHKRPTIKSYTRVSAKRDIPDRQTQDLKHRAGQWTYTRGTNSIVTPER